MVAVAPRTRASITSAGSSFVSWETSLAAEGFGEEGAVELFQVLPQHREPRNLNGSKSCLAPRHQRRLFGLRSEWYSKTTHVFSTFRR